MYLNNVQSAMIEKSTFSGSQAALGGTIYASRIISKNFFLRSLGLTIRNSSFFHNQATESAGCIFAGVESIVKVHCSEFANNRAAKAGGVFNLEGSMLESSLRNSSSNSFSSLHQFDEEPGFFLSHCTLRNNSAFVGGSFSFASSSIRGVLRDSVIDSSHAASVGGAVPLDVQSSFFKSNHALNGSSIVSISSPRVVVNSCQFSDNAVSKNGGALYAVDDTDQGMTLTIRNNTFTRNRAKFGGSLFLELQTSTDLTLSSSQFERGFAVAGGDIYFSRDIPLSIQGTFSVASISSESSSYGPVVATRPRYMRLTDVILEGQEATRLSANASNTFSMFSGQNVKIHAEIQDDFGQVVRFFDGLTFSIHSSAPRIEQRRSEEIIQQSRLLFDFNLLSTVGSVETLEFLAKPFNDISTIALKPSIMPCDPGYRQVFLHAEAVHDVCVLFPKGSYSILTSAPVCQTNCADKNCKGGQSVEWKRGFWNFIDLDAGIIESFPCPNGYCVGGQAPEIKGLAAVDRCEKHRCEM